MSIVTVGTDTEVFLVDKGGLPHSVEGLIGGTKQRPLEIPHGALQEDNVMPEFNTDPVQDWYAFRYKIDHVLSNLEQRMMEHDLSVVIKASMEFPESMLRTKQAAVFGCDPDFDAWALSMNTPVNPKAVGNWRTAGGHVHFGVDRPLMPDEKTDIVRCMDIYLGLPSVFMDEDTVRRQWYGRAGAMRDKPYGGEYRVLSNFWIEDQSLTRWVFEMTTWCVENHDEVLSRTLSRIDHNDIIQAINHNDETAAREICSYLGVDQYLDTYFGDRYAA